MHRPNILIVKLSAIGDVVHALPSLNAIRRYYPEAHITWLVEQAAASLLTDHPALDRVLISHRKKWLKGLSGSDWRLHLGEFSEFLKSVRDRRYDMIFDFQAALKGAVLIRLARGGRKIGFGPGLEHQELSYLMLNERIPAVSMEIHALERNLLMIEAAGIPYPSLIEYRLPITAEHNRQADRLLVEYNVGSGSNLVVVNPIAKWKTKLWQPDRFSQVADRLQARRDVRVLFTGGHEDHSAICEMQDQMRTESVNLAGRTDLLTLAALLQRAVVMITTDTGPMHIAAAVGTPTVALFGPTAPWRTGPYGIGHRIIRSPRPCGPCFKRECPNTTDCMSTISVDQVTAAAVDLLTTRATAPCGGT